MGDCNSLVLLALRNKVRAKKKTFTSSTWRGPATAATSTTSITGEASIDWPSMLSTQSTSSPRTGTSPRLHTSDTRRRFVEILLEIFSSFYETSLYSLKVNDLKEMKGLFLVVEKVASN